MTYKPKLIEVALPLSVINKFAAAEGSIGQRPHPKNLHRWWARRPLSAARAVIFASLVDDPSSDDSLSTAEQETERLRLFSLIERMVAVERSRDTLLARGMRVYLKQDRLQFQSEVRGRFLP